MSRVIPNISLHDHLPYLPKPLQTPLLIHGLTHSSTREIPRTSEEIAAYILHFAHHREDSLEN